MKLNNFFSITRTTVMAMAMIASAAGMLSCSEDNVPAGNASFSIEGNPTGMTATVATKTQSFVVRANGRWEIVARSEDSNWVKVFPTQGDDDGIFKITIAANQGFTERIANFAFVVDGQEQPVLFRVEQDANVPYVTLPATITIPSPGGNFDVAVNSNVPWTYTLSDAAWLTEVSTTTDKITLNAATNTAFAGRSVVLTVTASEYPTVSATVTLQQSPGTIVLEENFNWLAYGSAVPYTTGGETIITNWTEEQKARGWTSTLNPFSNDRPCYARQGFIKLGKTGYGGDIISPKLSTITGTKNLKVTFKAVAYLSAAGTVVDSRELKIEVLNAGTPSTSLIMVENVPNTKPQDDAGVVNDIWSPDRAFTFTITGATAETQIRFLGKDFDLRTATPTTNRIFLDDIKVEIVE